MKWKYLLLPVFILTRIARSPLWWTYQPSFKNWDTPKADTLLALVLLASVLIWPGFLLLYFAGLVLMALIYLFKKYPNVRRTKNIRDEKTANTGKP